MAKRLINKSRIKRLSTFPWEPGVETKDLRKANYEELQQAIMACKDKSSGDNPEVQRQQELLLERLTEAHSELPPPEPPPASTEFDYMADPEWVEERYPGLSRDMQAAQIEKADEDVLACVWNDEDACFMIYASVLKHFPFQTLFIPRNEEDQRRYEELTVQQST